MVALPEPVLEFSGRVAYEAHLIRPLLPTYLHLLLSSIFPIYVAAHGSLTRPKSAAPAPKGKEGDEDVEEEASSKLESLTASDAILFPILAGCTLCGLYFILKWLEDPAWLNWALGIYFSQAGIFFLTSFIRDYLSVLRSFAFPSQFSYRGQLYTLQSQHQHHYFKASKDGTIFLFPTPGLPQSLFISTGWQVPLWKFRRLIYTRAKLHLQIHKVIKLKSSFDVLLLVSFLISVLITLYQTFIAKPWYLTNLTGFSFCYGAMQLMSPTSGWIGTLILGALFFYDIYFVFFTPIMVTVATKLDVPIKLLFPRPEGMGMLGLGDIVIPGIVIAFALRFDLYLAYLRQGKTESGEKPTYIAATGGWGERFWTSKHLYSEEVKAKGFPKVYFYATLSGYLAGMVTTVLVMQVAQHAQPALLYLVPGVLISLWGTALVKGDLKTLWEYTEEEDEEDKKKTHGKEEANTKDGDEKSTADDKQGSSESTNQSKTLETKVDESGPIQLISFSITIPAKSFSSTSEVTSRPDHDIVHPDDTRRLMELISDLEAKAKADKDTHDHAPPDSEDLNAAGEGSSKQAVDVDNRDGEPPGKRRRKL